ncbi:MAG: hypothetical protein AB7G40_06225 [Hyphomonadaceae bacterium]
MTSLGRVLAAAAAVTLVAAPAYAQRINSNAQGTFGQIQLRTGFTPDPHVVTVNAGGPIDVATVSDNCRGFIAERPSFTLRYRAGDEYPLYVGVVADEDTTLVVRGPNGQWMCDDDSGDDLNPVISWENPRSGRYQIWVGRFGTSELAPAQLFISEIAGPADAVPTDLPDYTLNPNYGVIDLVSGFTPDPHTVTVTAGGEYNAYQIPGCVGSISRAPDYRVNFTAGDAGLPLIFSAQSESDTTLVINDAGGNWVCDDDGGNTGLNPSITFANPVSGQYDIWVGSYAEGDYPQAVLHVSELTSN